MRRRRRRRKSSRRVRRRGGREGVGRSKGGEDSFGGVGSDVGEEVGEAIEEGALKEELVEGRG